MARPINTPTSFRKSKFFASNCRKISVDLTPLFQSNREEEPKNGTTPVVEIDKNAIQNETFYRISPKKLCEKISALKKIEAFPSVTNSFCSVKSTHRKFVIPKKKVSFRKMIEKSNDSTESSFKIDEKISKTNTEPRIMEKTEVEFFSKMRGLLKNLCQNQKKITNLRIDIV